MDWSLLSCGRGGHVTYAPDEPDLRGRLSTVTPAGTAWRCLRCGTFVPGEPDGSGPVAAAPAVRRGREVRSALILRLFAIERYLRAVVFGGAAFGVWRLKYSRTSLQQAFDHDLPAVRALYKDLGFNFQNSKIIGLIQHALTLNSRTLGYLAIGLAAYAVIEFIEATGLWLVKRWGEYFALVVYLVLTKRMLGARGGKAAYEERLREASIIDAELEALAAAAPGSPDPQPPGAEPGEPDEAAEAAEAGAAQPGAASR